MAVKIVSTDCNYVQRVLDKSLKGLTRDYDVLVSQLSRTDLESKDLINYLCGLRNCISILNKDSEILIGVILKIDWPAREDAVVKEYQSWMLNLVSAHTYYIRACLRMLVKHFYPRSRDLPPEYVSDYSSIDDAARSKHDSTFSIVHTSIRNICHIVPTASGMLLTILEECAPFYTRDAFTQECYMKNLLMVTQYLSSYRLRVLKLIVDRMIQIDVRCPRHEIEDSEELADDEADQDVFDMETNDEQSVKVALAKSMQHPDANKLDVMMYLMLWYIRTVCHSHGQVNWESTKRLYKELLCVFEKVLLPTYASIHVQFIMFYLCSLKKALCEGFLDFLWKYFQNPHTETVYRQSAMSYVASLLARAKYVDISIVKMTLRLLCTWAHTYIEQATHTSRPDVYHHGAFYSTCQTVFYVFAFRHKEILDTHKDRKWAESLGLQTLVASRLNPLRVCLPVVTRTFANIARMHRLAFCDVIIERNDRSILSVAGNGGTRLTRVNPLDSFFPFDPYLLPRSNEFICAIYREFEGVVHEEDAPDVEEQDEFLEDVDQQKADNTHHQDVDFMNYGASPGFKHI